MMEPSPEQVAILRNCIDGKTISELLLLAGKSSRTTFREDILLPLMRIGWLEQTIPDKPTSKKQKYRTTVDGRKFLNSDQGSRSDMI
ncbi:MAG: hypothetical protein LBU06_01830 [Desulfovibrio sp.]|jgi:hypothetical protein|nr:hypothetical protein [Desulfovibrio sp.]